LPERYRAAVVLCDLEGHTYEAAACRLGWPVGTVKSRLSRGRDRLRARLMRRGVAWEDASSPVIMLPTVLARTTVEAMIRFATGRPTVWAISATALSRTFQTLRTTQLTRLAVTSALVISGLAAAGATMLTTQERLPAQTRTILSATPAGPQRELAEQALDAKNLDMVTVRVVDLQGKAVKDVDVEVLEHEFDHASPRYRTGADGLVRVAVDPHADPVYGVRFLARPDDRTIGWAYRPRSRERTDQRSDSIPLVLLPRTHAVEGSVVDKSAKPIPGARIRVVFLDHEFNRAMFDFECSLQNELLGPVITDEAGRYTLSLPDQTRANLVVSHTRYVGPLIECRADQRVIPPVTLEEAGGIAGTVLEGAKGRPVEGAKLRVNQIEDDGRTLIGSDGAMTDAHGRFRVGGLPPGVYNLCVHSSPRGERFPAQAIEGVRVRAGEDVPADLKLIAGRRVHGTVIDIHSGKPMSWVPIFCSSSARPSLPKAAFTDDQGHFEFFVPPGPACVDLDTSTRDVNAREAENGASSQTLIVAADRDPDPLRLGVRRGPNDSSRRRAVTPPLSIEVRVRVEATEENPKEGVRGLVGRIFDQNGAPIAGVLLTYDQGGQSKTCATDRLGVFRAYGLPLEKLAVSIHKKGYTDASAIIPPAACEVEITLSKRAVIPE
jgi:protocatechuate 3,4-dioxygenase beta subunit